MSKPFHLVLPSKSIQLCVLLFSMFICGGIAIGLGKELEWDLANYHYYIPYALIHHRWEIDYWPPSNFPIYLNPALDFLSYFLITFTSPWTAVFTLGALHGINIWLLFLLSYHFTRLYNPKHAFLIAFSLALIGMYGPISFSEIGSFMGDNINSIFILTAILFHISYLQNIQLEKMYVSINFKRDKFLFFSGIFLGMAVGFKFTAIIFVIGFFSATVLLKLSLYDRVKLLSVWSLALMIGFMLTAGYWSVFLWQHYQNPFFPFFNGIFHSHYFPFINWFDNRFLPKNYWQTFFYPFFFAWNGQTTDVPFEDYRFPILYIGYVSIVLYGAWRYIQKAKRSMHISWYWMMLCYVLTYIAWQVSSSNLRFAMTLQLITPLLIYLVLCYLFHKSTIRITILCALLAWIVLTMSFMANSRNYNFEGNYFNVRIPKKLFLQHNVVTLIAFSDFTLTPRPRPLAYFIPYFPTDWHFVGIPFKGYLRYELPDNIKTLITKDVTYLYLFASRETMPAFYQAAAQLGFSQKGPCETLYSERDPWDILLCPVQKNSTIAERA